MISRRTLTLVLALLFVALTTGGADARVPGTAETIASCDGGFKPQLRENAAPETKMAWVVMGVSRDQKSLWVGTKRAVQAKYLCAKLVVGPNRVDVEVWATYPFSECFINDDGDKECEQAVQRPALTEKAHPYSIPLGDKLQGRRISGARRSTVDAPLSRPFNYFTATRTTAVAIPSFVGLASRDGREVAAGLGFAGAKLRLVGGSGEIGSQTPAATRHGPLAALEPADQVSLRIKS